VKSTHCFSVRTSHQIKAGRTTSSDSSSITAPCICPEKPTQAIASPPSEAFPKALRAATPVARHQSSGRCSAHPICGEANGSCSSVAEEITFPDLSIIKARVPPVPISIPRTYMSNPQKKICHSEERSDRGTLCFHASAKADSSLSLFIGMTKECAVTKLNPASVPIACDIQFPQVVTMPQNPLPCTLTAVL